MLFLMRKSGTGEGAIGLSPVLDIGANAIRINKCDYQSIAYLTIRASAENPTATTYTSKHRLIYKL